MSENAIENSLVAVEGHFLSQHAQRFGLALREYDPTLEVQWIPPETHTWEGQPEFRVVCHSPTGLYILFYLKDESELNAMALQRVIVNDQRNGQVQYSEYEAYEIANARIKHQEFLDAMEEMNDVAKHVLRSRKHTYKVNDDLVIKAGIPFNAASLPKN